MNELIEKAKRILFRRKHAYQMVFDSENVFTTRVLTDLAKFCRANKSAFHLDPRAHAALEGRREVWLRICHHLKLTDDQIWEQYGRESE